MLSGSYSVLMSCPCFFYTFLCRCFAEAYIIIPADVSSKRKKAELALSLWWQTQKKECDYISEYTLLNTWSHTFLLVWISRQFTLSEAHKQCPVSLLCVWSRNWAGCLSWTRCENIPRKPVRTSRGGMKKKKAPLGFVTNDALPSFNKYLGGWKRWNGFCCRYKTCKRIQRTPVSKAVLHSCSQQDTLF